MEDRQCGFTHSFSLAGNTRPMLLSKHYSASSVTNTKPSSNGRWAPYNLVVKDMDACPPLNGTQIEGLHAADMLCSYAHMEVPLSEEDGGEADQKDLVWHPYDLDDNDALPGSLRSLRKRRTAVTVPPAAYKVKEKKKVGRPCTYQGDLDSPHLGEDDRRKLKRRLANRESARRVRQKRNQRKVELEAKMEEVQKEHSELQERCAEAEKGRLRLMSQLSHMQELWSTATVESAHLLSQVTALRNAAKVNSSLMMHTYSKECGELGISSTAPSSLLSRSSCCLPSPFAKFTPQLGPFCAPPFGIPAFAPANGGTHGCLTEPAADWATEADDWEALFGQATNTNAELCI